MKPDDEIIVIVDEKNRIIGAEPRSTMRSKGLIHRATYILVFNSAGQIFVQKRTLSKDVYPGYYDVATGGVVLDGETYEESAVRELEEELGIRNVPLKSHFDFYYQDGKNRVWGRVFSCVYDGEIILQAEEVERVVAGRFFRGEDREHVLDRVLRETLQDELSPGGPVPVSCARVSVRHSHHEAVLIYPEPGPAFSSVLSREDPYQGVLSLYGPAVGGKSRPGKPLIPVAGHHDRMGRKHSEKNDGCAHRPSRRQWPHGASKKGHHRLLWNHPNDTAGERQDPRGEKATKT